MVFFNIEKKSFKNICLAHLSQKSLVFTKSADTVESRALPHSDRTHACVACEIAIKLCAAWTLSQKPQSSET
jgi:hypothetical protein